MPTSRHSPLLIAGVAGQQGSKPWASPPSRAHQAWAVDLLVRWSLHACRLTSDKALGRLEQGLGALVPWAATPNNLSLHCISSLPSLPRQRHRSSSHSLVSLLSLRHCYSCSIPPNLPCLLRVDRPILDVFDPGARSFSCLYPPRSVLPLSLDACGQIEMLGISFTS